MIGFPPTPGTGARLHTVAPFTNMFTGMVINRDGSPWDGSNNYPPAPPFAGTNGSYLLGDKFAMPSSDTNVFLNVLGRLPNVGEQFTRLNATNQTYITSTYLGVGNWDIVPWITFGESGFFSLGTVFIPPASPFLSIALSGAAQVRVAWKTNAPGYLLYYITNLTDPGWQQVTNLPTVVGDHFAVTMEQDGSQRFFRLQK